MSKVMTKAQHIKWENSVADSKSDFEQMLLERYGIPEVPDFFTMGTSEWDGCLFVKAFFNVPFAPWADRTEISTNGWQSVVYIDMDEEDARWMSELIRHIDWCEDLID